MKLTFLLASSLAIILACGPLHAAEVTVKTVATIDAGSGGISVGPDGRIYSADFGSKLGGGGVGGTQVWAITTGGETEVFAKGLEGASGHAWDAEGHLYQSNIRGNKISRIAPDGTVTDVVSEGIVNPVGIVITADGSLRVANCGNGTIRRVTPTGESTEFVSSPLLKCPNGLALDEDGNLYAANFYDGSVIKITPAGEAELLATLPGNNNGHIHYANGELLVVARTAHQIYRVSLDGKVELLAGSGEKGGADGPANEASFCFPNDITTSHDGRTVWVNDIGNEETNGMNALGPTRIRRIDLGED